MTAYVIVGLTPKDPEKLKEYSAKAAPTIAKHKGEFIVKGTPTSLFGTYDYAMQVIIVFPSRELAETWYTSPEYQALIPVRNEGMDASFQLVG